MKPFDRFNQGNPKRPKRQRFQPKFETFEEQPEEEERLDQEKQERVKKDANKPKVPNRVNTSGPGFTNVEKKGVSKKPGLPTIQELEEGEQQRPNRTPVQNKNKNQGRSR